MLREHQQAFRQMMVAIDLAIIIVTFLASYYLRDLITPFGGDLVRGIYPLETYLGLLPLLIILWVGSFHTVGAYRPLRGRSIPSVLLDILKAGGLSLFAFATLAFLLKLHFVSRLLITLHYILTWFLLSLERVLTIEVLRIMRKRGYNLRYLLLVGTGRRAQNFLSLILSHPEWGFRIQGLIDADPTLKSQEVMGFEVLGTLEEVPRILEEKVVDEVVFVVPRKWLGMIEETILYCESVGTRVSVAVDLFSLQIAKAHQSGILDFPLLSFQTTTDKLGQLMIKRSLDILLSSLALLFLAPSLLLVAAIIKLTSQGPVFFKQIRCSLNGRVFTIYKFRTMVPNAEALLEGLLAHNEMNGPAFKMTRDPRITWFGRWLRKFSIDELPQLYNVLVGDMSFVGPRPPIPSEVKRYEPWQRRKLSMRPGLTCIWQCRGRNQIADFDEWMKMDLEYIDNWSLWLDFKIFLKTIPVVLLGIGGK